MRNIEAKAISDKDKVSHAYSKCKNSEVALHFHIQVSARLKHHEIRNILKFLIIIGSNVD